MIRRMGSCPDAILRLIEHFDRQSDQVRSPDYNETQIRIDFVNPMFAELGWDMDNAQRYAEQYREVVHEDRIKVAGATKAPDYSFRIGGTRKFFLEAKKPSVNIKESWEPAYQLRRYAWSAKLAVSILTDFEELAIYDCRIQPKQFDKASVARREYITYQQYPERWDFISGTFSKQAVLRGDFDRYCGSSRGRGAQEFDDAFLAEIEEWRKKLANHLAIRNDGIDEPSLNFAVQRIIDRIIFLRIAEDRGTEPVAQLQALLNGEHTYDRLRKVFDDADARYNSGLFHFKTEKGRDEAPDTLTPGLDIDDATLKAILRRLYYPESPYEFTVVTADILGSVYERFLGKVISLTAGHRARIEDKPEVRKAGGVYYTPTYIVDYIVKNTVGKLLEGKTPRQAAKLKVLDPACGSGSFLIGAYQHLLDWHLAQYIGPASDPKKLATGKSAVLRPGPAGDWRLTIAERKRILLDNIHGVDLDPAAVEVTKLNLLLKCLEGETSQTLGFQHRLFRDRALPDLGHNILCGNSLIGTDIMATDAWKEMTDEEKRRINPFEYERGFSLVFEQGGFDAVIGNPPYSYRNATEELLPPYYDSIYDSSQGNYDLYRFFIERGVLITRAGGLSGFIVSATFLVQPSFARLRELLLSKTAIEELCPLGPQVFESATVDTTILITRRVAAPADHMVTVRTPSQPRLLRETAGYGVRQSRFSSNDKHSFDYKLSESAGELFSRLATKFGSAEDRFEFGVGINTGYIRDELLAVRKLDKRYHPMLPGDGISRYGVPRTKGFIMYDRDFVRSRGRLGRTLPAERFFKGPKIVVVRTRNLSLPRRVIATLDTTRAYNLNRLSNIISRGGANLNGLLGILNSRLFQWLFSTRYFDYEIKPVYLRAAPIADTDDAQLVSLVETMLSLHHRLPAERLPQHREQIQREIDATDRRIDKRVYDIYSLSAEEIGIIEAGTNVNHAESHEP